MEASSLAGRFGVSVVKMSDNVAARSKSRVVRPGGAVVHVLGVVGVVGLVCAARGITPANATSSIAAVKVTSVFQCFIIVFSSQSSNTAHSRLCESTAGVDAPRDPASKRYPTRAPLDLKTRIGAELNHPTSHYVK